MFCAKASVIILGLKKAITAGLSEFCLRHNPLLENSSGWLHSFTSMVGSIGNMFVTDENGKNESLW